MNKNGIILNMIHIILLEPILRCLEKVELKLEWLLLARPGEYEVELVDENFIIMGNIEIHN